mmetsp:Transcript_24841/g.64464  ORF Transcript_24841/g.64464 Transcript_24841/m.64464 type:complete len:226 (-) Transcript_24841:96-773(-)
MARARPDWVQTLDPESGHWCWYSALRQESRWEKPAIREGWMEWRDANGNAFYVDDAGGSTWDPPWADADAEDADEAPETTREAPDAPMHPPAPPPREAVAPQPPAPPAPVSKTDDVVLKPMDRAAPTAPAYETGSTYAPPRAGTDLLAYERRRAAALVAAYQAERTKSRERRLRDDREALDRDRAALDRERQLLALERLRGENGNLPTRATVAALVVSTGLARNQ